MIAIEWKIVDLERDASTGRVTVAHWTAVATKLDYVASTYGAVTFLSDPLPNGPFIPYDQLTEVDVLLWVFTQVDKEETEVYLAEEIAKQESPPTQNGLPW